MIRGAAETGERRGGEAAKAMRYGGGVSDGGGGAAGRGGGAAAAQVWRRAKRLEDGPIDLPPKMR